jgi:hypothetical protein
MPLRLPIIEGIIRRRILSNFRVQPEVMQRLIPDRFKPKVHQGYAVAGICLIRLDLEGDVADELPSTSIFSSLATASSFFEGGSLGYSVTNEPGRLDGLRLKTKEWKVSPLNVRKVYSSYFADESLFPRGSIEFDHALIMRNVEHEWLTEDDLYV